MTAAHPKLHAASSATSAINQREVQAFRPLKIALLGYRSHPHVGGQGIYIKYLSKALSELGHHVEVFSGPPYPDLCKNVTLHRVPSLDLFASENHVRALRLHHLKSWSDTYEWWSMLTGGFAEPYTFGRRVTKLLIARDFDIIHDNQSLSYGMLKLQSHGHNIVTTIHHPIHQDRQLAIESAKNWLFRLLARRWYSFLDMQEKVATKLKHVVTVSLTSQKDIATCFNREENLIHVIPNGIDTNVFCPKPDISRNPFQLITTASSDQPLKGLKFLLLAITHLVEPFPEVQLIVIGKLKAGGQTEQLLKAYQLEKHVRFISGISTQSLVQHYAESSIAICPSVYEGFGLPVGEAMACGLPVVSTTGGALPEVVGNAGVLVSPKDEKALAGAISNLLVNPDSAKKLGDTARKRVRAMFCWNQVARQLSDFYYKVLNSATHEQTS